MKFTIITHAMHKKSGENYLAYEPYVREMNLWGEYVDEVLILAPKSNIEVTSIEASYNHPKIYFEEISNFNITSPKNIIKSFFVIPTIIIKIFNAMMKSDHIHLRCPGNIGLLGCIVQMIFPKKTKTVKYAGNWDPKSKQPLSYRVQKWILSNTFLTKNCKVLVYGDWPNQSENIIPFFTASYNEDEIIEIPKKDLNGKIKCVFVGAFSEGKQPLLSVKVVEKLSKELNFDIELHMYGYGKLYKDVEEYVKINRLIHSVFLHGNQSKEVVKKAFQASHFLIFISKSEGWPKVVSEAMFWGCLPVSSPISCVPFMLDKGKRGILVNDNIDEVVIKLKEILQEEAIYQQKVKDAKDWSQQFTLDKFSNEITNLLFK